MQVASGRRSVPENELNSQRRVLSAGNRSDAGKLRLLVTAVSPGNRSGNSRRMGSPYSLRIRRFGGNADTKHILMGPFWRLKQRQANHWNDLCLSVAS